MPDATDSSNETATDSPIEQAVSDYRFEALRAAEREWDYDRLNRLPGGVWVDPSELPHGMLYSAMAAFDCRWFASNIDETVWQCLEGSFGVLANWELVAIRKPNDLDKRLSECHLDQDGHPFFGVSVLHPEVVCLEQADQRENLSRFLPSGLLPFQDLEIDDSHALAGEFSTLNEDGERVWNGIDEVGSACWRWCVAKRGTPEFRSAKIPGKRSSRGREVLSHSIVDQWPGSES